MTLKKLSCVQLSRIILMQTCKYCNNRVDLNRDWLYVEYGYVTSSPLFSLCFCLETELTPSEYWEPWRYYCTPTLGITWVCYKLHGVSTKSLWIPHFNLKISFPLPLQLENTHTALSCPRFRAALDNIIHVHIGVLSWSILDPIPWSLNADLLAVALGSSLIDIDHFIAAKSWSFDKAMHAPHRGPFHSTGLLFLVFLGIYRYSPHNALVFLVSFLPHHLRDSQRRGIYVFPPASLHWETRPIPVFLVRLLIPALPWVLVYLRDRFGVGVDQGPVLPKVWVAWWVWVVQKCFLGSLWYPVLGCF